MTKSQHAPEQFTISPGLSQLLLFAIGFVAVSMQFIYMRQVSPFVGSSTVVSSIVVSIFLGALALGVSKGGRIERNQTAKLRRNLAVSSLILAIGPSYVVVSAFFGFYYSTVGAIPGVDVLKNPLIALTVYLLIFMFPLIYLIEQSVPLLINFMKEARAAKLAGDAFNKSTWGNVIGGAFTTVVLMYYLGMAWTITINAIILCLIATIASPKSKRKSGDIAMTIGLAIIAYCFNVFYENGMFVKTTPYQNYEVINYVDGSRVLITNTNNSSQISKDGKVYPYLKLTRQVLFPPKKDGDLTPTTPKDYLVVGAGGFTLTEAGAYGNHVTYVDIDPQIKEVAEKYFLEKSITGDFVAEDARSYLNRTESKKWDAVVLDAYTGMNSLPKTLITKEFFELLKSRMKPDGRVVMNMIINADFSDPFSKAVDNTIRSVFRYCQATSMYGHSGIDNVIYVCFMGAGDDYNVIYTDNNTKHEHDAQELLVDTIKRKTNLTGIGK